MLKVLFFAQTRELIGIGELNIEARFPTAEALRQALVANEKGINGR